VWQCPGTAISKLIVGISDVDANALRGIAVTAANTANGFWQFTLNKGATWQLLGQVSGKAARLLPADGEQARLRFVPKAGFKGTASITYFAWDRTHGSAGQTVDISLPGRRGGTTAFSTDARGSTITVSPVELQRLSNERN